MKLSHKKTGVSAKSYAHPLKSQRVHPLVMGSKCTPRHDEYFFTRREWWKQKETLNPKQNLSKPVTPLQTSVVDKLSTSSILYRATFYQLDVSIESTKRIYQGPKVLSWWVRFILDKHDIINDWNLTKSWTKWKSLDNF